MSKVFVMVEGNFGKVVLIEIHHDLVPQAHREIHFGYWIGGGQCHGFVGDETVVYNNNKSVEINCYQAHNFSLQKSTEPVIMLMLYINETWFDEHFTHHATPVIFQKAQLIHTDEMKAKCWNLIQKILLIKEQNSSITEYAVLKLVQSTIDGNIALTKPSSNAVRRKMLDYRLRMALNLIHENMRQPHLMQDLAKLVGVSRSRLYKLFKNELQSTPKLILNGILLDIAIKHMTETKDNMTTISKQLGFSTLANFSRFFRSHKGLAPSSYRKICMSVSSKQARTIYSENNDNYIDIK